MPHTMSGVAPDGTPWSMPGFHLLGPGGYDYSSTGGSQVYDPTPSVAPAASGPVVDFWQSTLGEIGNVDWSSGSLFGSGQAGQPSTTWTGPTPGTGIQKDMYGADFSDPFGQFMFGTFGRAGKWGAGAGSSAYQTLGGAAGQIPGLLSGPADWMEDMAKLGVLGLGALAIIMVAK